MIEILALRAAESDRTRYVYHPSKRLTSRLELEFESKMCLHSRISLCFVRLRRIAASGDVRLSISSAYVFDILNGLRRRRLRCCFSPLSRRSPRPKLFKKRIHCLDSCQRGRFHGIVRPRCRGWRILSHSVSSKHVLKLFDVFPNCSSYIRTISSNNAVTDCPKTLYLFVRANSLTLSQTRFSSETIRISPKTVLPNLFSSFADDVP